MKQKRSTRDVTKQAFVLQQIRDQIVDGTYPPGSRLPLRTDMETIFGVSWFTLHRVFEQLTREGFVHSRGRGGTYVCNHPPHLSHYAVVVSAHAPEGRLEVIRKAVARLESRRAGHMCTVFKIGPEPDNDDHRVLVGRLRNQAVAGLVLFDETEKMLARDLARYPRVPRIVARPCIPQDHLAVVVDRDWSAFLQRGCAALKRAGSSRVACLSPETYLDDSMAQLPETAARHDLTGRPEWVLMGSVLCPQCAEAATSLLMSLPPQQRPDGLLLGYPVLCRPVMEALTRCGLVDDVRMVFQCGNGDTIDPPDGALRVLYDEHDILYRAFDAIDRLRAGQDVPRHVTVPPRPE